MPPTIGIDVGQSYDPTAIAVMEPEVRNREDAALDFSTHWTCRHLERLQLGQPYPEIAKRLAYLIFRITTHYAEETIRVYVDATGVGKPIVDILADEVGSSPVRIIPVYFTHGDKYTHDQTGVKMGKAWLVTRLRVLLEDRRLHLPKTAEARALAEELMDYEIKIDKDANEKYGAFKVGAHDDLVTAVGLACQREPIGLELVW